MTPRASDPDDRSPTGPVPARDAGVFDALSSGPRMRMLELLSASPRSVPDLERELAMPRVTIRYHVSVLLGQGLVEEVPALRGRKVGRPAKMYRANRRASVPGYPRRRFEIIGELALRALLEESGETRACGRLRVRGQEVGEALIRDLAARGGITVWTPEAFDRAVLGHFREQGSPVEVLSRADGEVAYRSACCPFLELAEKMPNLVCDSLDVGFHEGVDRALGDVRTERIACMGHGAPYCEYRVRWGRTRQARRPVMRGPRASPGTG